MNTCYKYISIKAGWSDASSHCASDSNSSLLVLDTMSKLTYYQSILKKRRIFLSSEAKYYKTWVILGSKMYMSLYSFNLMFFMRPGQWREAKGKRVHLDGR